jgi:hypothetical protein
MFTWLKNDFLVTYGRAISRFKETFTHQTVGGIISGFGACLVFSRFWSPQGMTPTIVGWLLFFVGNSIIRPYTPYWNKPTNSSISQT